MSDIYVAHFDTGTIIRLDEATLVDLADFDGDEPNADYLNAHRHPTTALRWDKVQNRLMITDLTR